MTHSPDTHPQRIDLADDDQSPSAETAQEAKETARELRTDAKQKSRRARDKTLERGQQFAEERKTMIAKEVGVFGSAVRSASESLEADGEESVAQYAEMCAEELEQASDYLGQRSVQDLYHDANRFARKHPQVFLGGMFIAGIVAARFLKASEPEPETRDPMPPPSSGGPQNLS
ncbi:hypothetical protein [Bremerella alba]|uniref:Uncharacterized protein n=1 Tax=Bremerella alba TaxID=980252 RepID=A0A7V8V4L9_9BACT|nr:hypothetical protein [Bremerella alba]MBA2114656.1 hypothetical protein [Bremerella alba]